ncbi:hypothetical protein F4604DRAFT_1672398 [Suillus subluteus]|nr:hypothetical protein F4604DRAFT_1672398 [Suillus subluteus]
MCAQTAEDMIPSIGGDAGNVGAACSNVEFPERASSLQYLYGKRARMWLSYHTRAGKELDRLMTRLTCAMIDSGMIHDVANCPAGKSIENGNTGLDQRGTTVSSGYIHDW